MVRDSGGTAIPDGVDTPAGIGGAFDEVTRAFEGNGVNG
jgi:hypothetical protein